MNGVRISEGTIKNMITLYESPRPLTAVDIVLLRGLDPRACGPITRSLRAMKKADLVIESRPRKYILSPSGLRMVED